MEPRLLLILASLFLIVQARSYDSPYCSTGACQSEAAELRKRMDLSTNPCDDFYKFVCGGYIKNTPIPSDKTEVTALSELEDLVNEQLRLVVQEPSRPGELRPFRLVKDFYRSCMDEQSIERNGLATIKRILKDLGGWPIIEETSWENTRGWLDIAAELKKNGLAFDSFVSMGIENNPRDPFRKLVIIDQPEFQIGVENLRGGITDELIQSYADYLTGLAVVFGANQNTARREVEKVIELIAKLTKNMLLDSEHNDLASLIEMKSIRDVIANYPDTIWLQLVNLLTTGTKRRLNEADIIGVVSHNYLKTIGNLLKTTPKTVQANYAIFWALDAYELYLPKAVRAKKLEFSKIGFGTSENPPRSQECMSAVIKELPLATSAMYVRKYFDADSKIAGDEIVTNIRNQFIKIAEELNWMDSETKGRAMDKARAIATHVAFPIELLDDSELENYYAELTYDSHNILDIVRKVDKFNTDKASETLWKAVNKTDWTTRISACTINAVYDPTENSVTLPAGIMQGMFFKRGRPNYMNYGALGLIVGHEITHGFDTRGKRFDKNGILSQWWAEETENAFEEKAQCFVNQYGSYLVPEIRQYLDGELTLGENIADNGGMKEAYLAYQTFMRNRQPEPKLPGFDYTPNQMFWISAAAAWCETSRPESLLSDVSTDEHSPGHYRILGSFSNNENFARDFQCPQGSRMNPARKCSIW